MVEKYLLIASRPEVCEIRLYISRRVFITNRNALATKGLWSRRERVQRLIIQSECVNSPCVGNSVEVADAAMEDGGMSMRSMRLPAAEVLALPLQRLA